MMTELPFVVVQTEMLCLCRQREEEAASVGVHDLEATVQFEQDLQTLQASIDAEFGKDSDISGKQLSWLVCFTYSS